MSVTLLRTHSGRPLGAAGGYWCWALAGLVAASAPASRASAQSAMSFQEFKQLADRTFWSAHDRTFLGKHIRARSVYRAYKLDRSLDVENSYTCLVDYLSSRDSFCARLSFSDCVGTGGGYTDGQSVAVVYRNGRLAKVRADGGKPAVLTRLDPPVEPRAGRPREPWFKLELPPQVLDAVAIGLRTFSVYAPASVAELAAAGRAVQIERAGQGLTVRAGPQPGATPPRSMTFQFTGGGPLRLDRREVVSPAATAGETNRFGADGRPKGMESFVRYTDGSTRRLVEVEVTGHEDASPPPEAFGLAQFGLPEFVDGIAPPSPHRPGRPWLVGGFILLTGGALWVVRRYRG